jgi:GGDEF domain-containing protein
LLTFAKLSSGESCDTSETQRGKSLTEFTVPLVPKPYDRARQPLRQSALVAERVRGAMVTLAEPHLETPVGIVTRASGVAAIPTADSSIEQLLARADAALEEPARRPLDANVRPVPHY